MKKFLFIVKVLICIFCFSNCSVTEKKIIDEQVYGQKPPGKIPEIYEPKFTFIKNVNSGVVSFSTDFNEILYSVDDTLTNERIIFYTKKNKGKWDKPKIAYFVPNNGAGRFPKFSPDGRYISYTFKGDIWRSTKNGDKWTVAEKMLEPVNTDKYECDISFAQSGSVYFAGNGRINGNKCDIYYVKNNETKLDSACHLDNLSTHRSECTVTVSPNEKYIVFTRYFRKQGQNATDLYISFRKKDSTWTVAQNIGPYINSLGSNTSPRFSNDGKYFFFKQGIWNNKLDNYERKQYWVSTKFFDDMRDFVFSSNNIVE